MQQSTSEGTAIDVEVPDVVLSFSPTTIRLILHVVKALPVTDKVCRSTYNYTCRKMMPACKCLFSYLINWLVSVWSDCTIVFPKLSTVLTQCMYMCMHTLLSRKMSQPCTHMYLGQWCEDWWDLTSWPLGNETCRQQQLVPQSSCPQTEVKKRGRDVSRSGHAPWRGFQG